MLARAIAVLAVLVAMSGLASAHSWYGKYRDPVYGYTTCCGGTDCGPLPPGSIHNEPDGLHVVLTLEQAKAINRARDEAFDEFIPFDRIQLSEDGGPHICLEARNFSAMGDKRQGFFCIFMPPNG